LGFCDLAVSSLWLAPPGASAPFCGAGPLLILDEGWKYIPHVLEKEAARH